MAYLPQKKKKAPELATGQPTTQTTTPSTSTKPATPTTTPNKSNTGWTNLNQYLDANKGAGTQMGKQVQAKVSTDVNQAKANLSDFTKAMNKQVNDQKLDTASLVQGLKNSPAKVDRNSYQKAQKHTYKGRKPLLMVRVMRKLQRLLAAFLGFSGGMVTNKQRALLRVLLSSQTTKQALRT